MRLKLLLIFVMMLGLTWVLRLVLVVSGALLIADWHVFAFVCSLPGALAVWILLRERADPDAWLVSGCFVLAVVLLAGMKWFSRDYFLADFYRVQPGMTESEVEATLGKYRKGGRYLAAEPRHVSLAPAETPKQEDATVPLCQAYRHSTDADWGTVCYRRGRVIDTDFSPD